MGSFLTYISYFIEYKLNEKRSIQIITWLIDLTDTINNESELKLSNVIVDSIIGFCKPDRNDDYNTKVYEFLNGFSEDSSKSR